MTHESIAMLLDRTIMAPFWISALFFSLSDLGVTQRVTKIFFQVTCKHAEQPEQGYFVLAE